MNLYTLTIHLILDLVIMFYFIAFQHICLTNLFSINSFHMSFFISILHQINMLYWDFMSHGNSTYLLIHWESIILAVMVFVSMNITYGMMETGFLIHYASSLIIKLISVVLLSLIMVFLINEESPNSLLIQINFWF